MQAQLTGAISGAVATAPMTALMIGLHSILPRKDQYPLPPREIMENAAAEAGVNQHLTDQERTAATWLSHFGYGAMAGLAYGALAGKSGTPPGLEGALYGLAVWGGSYLGLMPATGLYRSAEEEPASRNMLMIAAHLVWGAALGVTYDMLLRRSQRSEA